jgi:hypothetical protein
MSFELSSAVLVTCCHATARLCATIDGQLRGVLMAGINGRLAAASLLIVVACGGSSTPTAPSNPPGAVLLPGNRPPIIASVTVTPEFGIADLEVFTFDVRASDPDPDGDQLTYAWRFEVGPSGQASGSGPRATARYLGGVSTSWPVSVVVSDRHGATTTGAVSVMVGSINGRWTVTNGAFSGARFFLVQSESGAVTGEYVLSRTGSLGRIEASRPGQITPAAVVTLPLRVGSRVMTFTGTMDTTGRRVAGTINGASCVLTAE